MSRRAFFVAIAVFALIGGRLLANHGIRSFAAAPSGTGGIVFAASVGHLAGSSGAWAVRQPVAPESVDGVNDIDPHKAFGSKSAPIVMEIFSDYQCPACRQYFETTNRPLMDNYVSTGKVFLIHRDFPLPMHAYSRIAARYARAAAEVGKIEPVEQALFDNQEKWEQTGDVDGTVAAALTPAEMAKVRALVKGGTLEPLINKDYELGEMYRVSQTPTTVFHYKGQTYPYAGEMNYEILSQFLNQLLNQR
ncbi:MAG: thioredoxin domain-containing protein [Candidatus Acidiferrum sp.]